MIYKHFLLNKICYVITVQYPFEWLNMETNKGVLYFHKQVLYRNMENNVDK
jgi:hypothetical protein